MPENPPKPSLAALCAWCDRFTAWLLGTMLVFSPWAFGTTQTWSIQLMNAGGWALGALCLVHRGLAGNRQKSQRVSSAVAGMALLTALLLAYILASAWNASATYFPGEWRLQEHPFLSWLPHSYDAPATWKAFWNFLALASAFWATHDWLASSPDRGGESRRAPQLSSRLRLLLWIMSLNAALLALEAVVQRTSGTPNLLWFQPTHDNKDAAAQFGPFAYRSNAAQYLNLVWPVTLGFWWWLQREAWQRGKRRGLQHVLLPCVLVMAAAALYSLSRAGAGIAAMLLVAACVLLGMQRDAPLQMRIGVLSLGLLTLAAGIFVSWNTLSRRFADTWQDPLSGRAETYAIAEGMARDYPWFGTGPGTFNNLFQVYRENPEQYWPAQLHNDWLEMRITFGRVGFALILAALVIASLRWLTPGGVPRDNTFLLLTLLALTGCLAHARYDFPFQIYSIQFVFVVLAAVLFSSSRVRRSGSRGAEV
ncbi:MAG TPA: O-antigen ligase family protein [Candidatus Acidoferrum sp.]|nr:O-antigen ligase family protein [Candidatus Acidoferrum sp.]